MSENPPGVGRSYTRIPGYEHYEHRTPLEFLFEDFMRAREEMIKERSKESYRRTFNIFAEHFGRRPLESITQEDGIKLLNKMRARGWAPSVIVWRLMFLKYLLSWGVGIGMFQKMPIHFRRLPKIAVPRSDKLPFTWEEHQKVLAEAADERYYRFWIPACRIAWGTGLRIGDISQLELSTVDFDREVVFLGSIKKSSVREKLEIPIEPDLRPLLLELRERAQTQQTTFLLLQMSTYYRIQRQVLANEFRDICDRVGLPRHSFHCYRHAFVSRLLNAGVDPITISSMTGQTLEVIQKHYAHVSVAAKLDALARSRAVLGIAHQTVKTVEIE